MNFLGPLKDDFAVLKAYIYSTKPPVTNEKETEEFNISRRQAKFIGIKALGIFGLIGIAALNYKKFTSIKFLIQSAICITAYNTIKVSNNAANLQKMNDHENAKEFEVPSELINELAVGTIFPLLTRKLLEKNYQHFAPVKRNFKAID